MTSLQSPCTSGVAGGAFAPLECQNQIFLKLKMLEFRIFRFIKLCPPELHFICSELKLFSILNKSSWWCKGFSALFSCVKCKYQIKICPELIILPIFLSYFIILTLLKILFMKEKNLISNQNFQNQNYHICWVNGHFLRMSSFFGAIHRC